MPELEQDHVEALIRDAAEKVATVVLAGTDRDRQAIVDRAVRDAIVDRDLRDHARHLEEINGSQARMAKSLEGVEDAVGRISSAFDKQIAVTEALSKHVKDESGFRLSRSLVWVGFAAAVAAYLSIVVIILIKFA